MFPVVVIVVVVGDGITIFSRCVKKKARTWEFLNLPGAKHSERTNKARFCEEATSDPWRAVSSFSGPMTSAGALPCASS